MVAPCKHCFVSYLESRRLIPIYMCMPKETLKVYNRITKGMALDVSEDARSVFRK